MATHLTSSELAGAVEVHDDCPSSHEDGSEHLEPSAPASSHDVSSVRSRQPKKSAAAKRRKRGPRGRFLSAAEKAAASVVKESPQSKAVVIPVLPATAEAVKELVSGKTRKRKRKRRRKGGGDNGNRSVSTQDESFRWILIQR